MDESRLASTSTTDGVDELHAAAPNLGEIEHANFQPVVLGHFLGGRREGLRVEDVGGLVAEIARQIDGGTYPLPESESSFRLRRYTARSHHGDSGKLSFRFSLAGEIFGESIRAELEPLGDRTELALEPGGHHDGNRSRLFRVPCPSGSCSKGAH